MEFSPVPGRCPGRNPVRAHKKCFSAHFGESSLRNGKRGLGSRPLRYRRARMKSQPDFANPVKKVTNRPRLASARAVNEPVNNIGFHRRTDLARGSMPPATSPCQRRVLGVDLKRVAVAFHIDEEATGVQTRESNVCSIVAALAGLAMAVGMAVAMALVWATTEPRYHKTFY